MRQGGKQQFLNLEALISAILMKMGTYGVSCIDEFPISYWMEFLPGVKESKVKEILERAKNFAIAAVSRSLEEEKREAIAFYKALVSNPRYSPTFKMKARQRLDKILGLEGDGGTPNVQQYFATISPDTLQSIAKQIAEQVSEDDSVAN